MEHDCPTCSDSFDTEHGLKIHHARAHGESLVEKCECETCGDLFKRTPGNPNRFCSRKCMELWKSDSISGDSNPNWSGGSVELVCEECGDVFYRKPAQEEPARFCSYDCKRRNRSRTDRGEANPNWKGGHAKYYGENWAEKRLETIERDGEKCANCGMGREEHFEQYDRDLHVHHIEPLRKFDEPEDANTLDNLVTLCEGCHYTTESTDGVSDPRETNPDTAISTD